MSLRKYVVGDVRGELNLLKALLDKIGPTESDTVIFLGSYIGPGPDSKGVMDLVMELRRKMPDTFIFLKGCYEYMFPRCLGNNVDWDDAALWGNMFGHKVFESYASKKSLLYLTHGKHKLVDIPLEIPADHLRFMEGELNQWFTDDALPFVACHAGSHPSLFGVPGNQCAEQEAYFSANGWWDMEQFRLPGKDIVFSHAPFQKPLVKKGVIGIDLGAGFGGKLCAWEAYSRNFTIVG